MRQSCLSVDRQLLHWKEQTLLTKSLGAELDQILNMGDSKEVELSQWCERLRVHVLGRRLHTKQCKECE